MRLYSLNLSECLFAHLTDHIMSAFIQGTAGAFKASSFVRHDAVCTFSFFRFFFWERSMLRIPDPSVL